MAETETFWLGADLTGDDLTWGRFWLEILECLYGICTHDFVWQLVPVDNCFHEEWMFRLLCFTVWDLPINLLHLFRSIRKMKVDFKGDNSLINGRVIFSWTCALEGTLQTWTCALAEYLGDVPTNFNFDNIEEEKGRPSVPV